MVASVVCAVECTVQNLENDSLTSKSVSNIQISLFVSIILIIIIIFLFNIQSDTPQNVYN